MLKQILHYPRLDTILSVENVLKKAKTTISKNEIDRRLPNQVMRPTLNLILRYLEQSGKIALLKQGIIWIYKDDISSKLRQKLKNGVKIT